MYTLSDPLPITTIWCCEHTHMSARLHHLHLHASIVVHDGAFMSVCLQVGCSHDGVLVCASRMRRGVCPSAFFGPRMRVCCTLLSTPVAVVWGFALPVAL